MQMLDDEHLPDASHRSLARKKNVDLLRYSSSFLSLSLSISLFFSLFSEDLEKQKAKENFEHVSL
jgi:hypothetical protein